MGNDSVIGLAVRGLDHKRLEMHQPFPRLRSPLSEQVAMLYPVRDGWLGMERKSLDFVGFC